MNPSFRDSLAEAKARLTIPELWRMLALPGDPPPGGTGVCRNPLREDRNPSLSIFAGGTAFKDHATGEGGDAVKFLSLATGLEGKPLLDRFRELAGVYSPAAGKRAPASLRGLRPKAAAAPSPAKAGTGDRAADISVMRRPTREELLAVARQRRLSVQGVALAAHRGFLRTGGVRGHECWICGEWSGRIATARRMDGLPFSRANGDTYKSHALSTKGWPVGLCGLPRQPSANSAVLLVEGEGDFLSAFHFITQWGQPDLYPVALLGRTLNLRPEVLKRLTGWRIRIFPHADADCGGWAAAEQWAAAIPEAQVDAYYFGGLRKEDGSPVKDLNDCTFIHSEDEAALEEMNPLPPRPHLDPARLEFDFANDMRAVFWGRIAGTTEEGFPVLKDGTVIPF